MEVVRSQKAASTRIYFQVPKRFILQPFPKVDSIFPHVKFSGGFTTMAKMQLARAPLRAAQQAQSQQVRSAVHQLRCGLQLTLSLLIHFLMNLFIVWSLNCFDKVEWYFQIVLSVWIRQKTNVLSDYEVEKLNLSHSSSLR